MIVATPTRLGMTARFRFRYAILGTALLFSGGTALAQDTTEAASEDDTLVIEVGGDASANTAAAPEAAEPSAQAENPNSAKRKRSSGGGSTSAVVDEVIVSATKRNIEAMDLPVSVSALDEDTLDNGGVNNTAVTAFYMPSLGIYNEPTWSFVSIRGMGSGLNGGFEQSVGIVYDGINMGRPTFMNDPLIDTQQLEVLRGPQGTVTGKNAVAGAFVVTSGKPFFEWGGKFDVSIDDYTKDHDGYETQGVFTGPIIDDVLAFRVAYSKKDVEGDLYNETLDRHEAKQDNWAARGALLLVLDEWEINLSHKMSNVSENGPNHDIAFVGDTFELVMAPYGTVEDDQFDRRTARDYPGQVDRDSTITSLQINRKFGALNTKIILGMADQDNFVALDADWGPAPVIVTETATAFKQHSAEINFSQDFFSGGADGIEDGLPGWIAGLFYYHSDMDLHNSTPLLPEGAIGLTPLDLCLAANCAADVLALLPVGPAGRTENMYDFDQSNDSYAGFFEVTLPTFVVPRTLFTVGARYTVERKTVDAARSLPPSNELNLWTYLIPDTENFAASRSFRQSGWSGRFSLQWFPPGDQSNVYFTAARGWKAGGFNTAAGIPDELQFDPETSWTVELGWKARFWDDTAGFNATIYYGEFQDLQTETYNGEKFIVSNAGSASTEGIEIELGVEGLFGIEGLDFGSQWSTVNVKFIDYKNGPCMAGVSGSCDQSGKAKGGHTPFSGAAGLNYTTPLFNWGIDLNLQASYIYNSESTGQDDQDPRVRTNSFWAAVGRVGIKDPDGLWNIYLACSNCNGHEVSGGFDVPVFTDTIAHVSVEGRPVWTVRAYGRF
ncbi:MAG: TonB-dependent receptor [Alphaproteobacteria bacterium]